MEVAPAVLFNHALESGDSQERVLNTVENRAEKSGVCLLASAAVLLLALYLALDSQWREFVHGVAKSFLFIGSIFAFIAAACVAVVLLLRAMVWLAGVPLAPITWRVLRSQMMVVYIMWLTVWSAVLLVLQQYGFIEDPGYTKLPSSSIIIAGFGAFMLGTCLSNRKFFQWIDASALRGRWRHCLHVVSISSFAYTVALFIIMWVSGALQS